MRRGALPIAIRISKGISKMRRQLVQCEVNQDKDNNIITRIGEVISTRQRDYCNKGR